jgi:hypothetical protein
MKIFWFDFYSEGVVQPIDARPSCDVDKLFSNGLMCKPIVKVQGVDIEHMFLFWWQVWCGCTAQLTLELQAASDRYADTYDVLFVKIIINA